MKTKNSIQSLELHLLDECQAMAKYAFSAGLKVAPRIVHELDALDCYLHNRPAPDTNSAEEKMSRQRARSGKTSSKLSRIHAELSSIVYPAKPGTLLLLVNESGKRGFYNNLGPVPLIRRMMFVAILSLISLVLVTLSPEVNGKEASFSLLQNSGVSLLLNELFLLTAAAIGASFYALFQANKYIKNGTYDSRYESSYWIRFVLGLMAGTIMATLIPLESMVADNAGQVGKTVHGLGKPMLAMLGGFSAAVVYRILNRLVSAVESLVRGDATDMMAAREKFNRVLVAEKEGEERLKMAANMLQLRHEITENSDIDSLRSKFDSILGELMPQSDNGMEFEVATAGAPVTVSADDDTIS